jgi:hypothetical protein
MQAHSCTARPYQLYAVGGSCGQLGAQQMGRVGWR